MDDELIFIIVFILISLFIFLGVMLVIIAFAILLTRSLYKSKSIRKISRKWDFEFYGIEDIRERLDNIAEINKRSIEQNVKIETLEKQNKELLKKLDYLVGPAGVRDKTKDE